MKASVRHHGKVTVVDLSGKITIGDGDIKLREAVNALLDEGRKAVILNLHGVSYMDSAGIGELVACYKGAADPPGASPPTCRARRGRPSRCRASFSRFDSTSRARVRTAVGRPASRAT